MAASSTAHRENRLEVADAVLLGAAAVMTLLFLGVQLYGEMRMSRMLGDVEDPLPLWTDIVLSPAYGPALTLLNLAIGGAAVSVTRSKRRGCRGLVALATVLPIAGIVAFLVGVYLPFRPL